MRSVYKRNYHVVSAYVQGGAKGSDIAQKYKIRGFPRMIFVEPSGRLLCHGAFNHVDDALELDRYVQRLKVDKELRANQSRNRACTRLPEQSAGEMRTAQ